jgi:4-amino-4-deoxy-L-arabinose transferase-like glycosyltransferase
LGLIFVIAFITRFYKLGNIPNGLYQDETAIGYNAYSVLKTGKDEHNVRLPIYFKSFGDWKLPVYIYTTVPFIKLFGLTPLAVRMPSALFGFFTVILFYFFVLRMCEEHKEKEKIALLAALFLSINPWHIHYSRAAFEVSIALFFTLTGTYAWFLSFVEKKRGAFFLGVLCFIISFYSYNLTRLLTPLMAGAVLYVFKSKLHKTAKVEYITSMIIVLLLLFPFILNVFTKGGYTSASGTLIFSSATVQAQLLEFRSYMIQLPPYLSKILFNMPALTLWHWINNVCMYVNVPFFFISGSSHGNHGIGNVGQFYLFEFPFILTGLYIFIRNKYRSFRLLLWWAEITVAVCALTRDVPHATRSFFLIPTLILASSLGCISIITHSKTCCRRRYQYMIFITASIFFMFTISYYFASYYIRFPVAYARSWNAADNSVGEFIRIHEKEYNSIIIDKNAGFPYTSLLFYTEYTPQDFQGAEWSKDDTEGFSFPIRFGKYEFKTIDWESDMKRPNTLIVTKSETIPKTITPITTFTYPMRPVVIAVKQELFQYPVVENAYSLVATNR